MPAERERSSDRGSSTGGVGPKRIAKACEACRVRRTKCDGHSPCSKCTEAGGLECTYRARARPSRQLRIHRPLAQQASSTSNSPDDFQSDEPRPQGIRAVEIDLEKQCEAVTGHPISLVLPDLGTHPSLALETPLPPPPDPHDPRRESLCETFVRDILPFFDFLSPVRMTQLVKRQRDLPGSLTDDQLALLYAIYAMGYLRQVTYASAGDSDQVLVAGEALLPLDPSVHRLDATYFRHAVDLVRIPTTVTALQALIVLQLYCMAAASMHTTRQIVGKLCFCVEELGLLKANTAAAYPAESGTAALGFYVLFTDVCWAGLTGEPPFITDFDADIFSSAAGTGGIVAPAIGELILLESEVLTTGRNAPAKMRDPAYVLSLETRLHAFLQRFGSQTNDCSTMTAYFATKHYHWLRILIRAPSATTSSLGMSSLAVLARSATLLLVHYERIFLTTRFVNCAWTVFARIVGAGHVVLQALWRGEMIRGEAAEYMGKVIWFLSKLETRWFMSAPLARSNFQTLMTALDLEPVTFVLPATGLGGASASMQPLSPSPLGSPATNRPVSTTTSVSGQDSSAAVPLAVEVYPEGEKPRVSFEDVPAWPLDSGLFDDSWMLGLGAPATATATADGGDWWASLPNL